MRKDIKAWLGRLPWGLSSIRVAVKVGSGPLETLGQLDLDEPELEDSSTPASSTGEPADKPTRRVEDIEAEIRAMLEDANDEPDVIKLTAYAGNRVVRTLQDTRPKEDKPNAGPSDAAAILAKALSDQSAAMVRMMDASTHSLKAQGEAFSGVLERLVVAQDDANAAKEAELEAKLEATLAEVAAAVESGQEEASIFDKVAGFLDGVIGKASNKGPDLETPEGLAAFVTLNGSKLKAHMKDPRVMEALSHLYEEGEENPPEPEPTS